MGIYVYTMRKDMLEVADMKIGRFSYAYKDGWGASRTRTATRLMTMAERAQEAYPDLEYVVLADSFNRAKEYKLPIYRKQKCSDMCVEEPKIQNPNSPYDFKIEVVGWLTKVGRKFKIEMVDISEKI